MIPKIVREILLDKLRYFDSRRQQLFSLAYQRISKDEEINSTLKKLINDQVEDIKILTEFLDSHHDKKIDIFELHIRKKDYDNR